jgi:hypothetical protein
MLMGIFEIIFGKKEKPTEPVKKEVKELDSESLGKLTLQIEEKELRIMQEKGKIITGKLRNAVSAFNSDLTALSNMQLTEEHKKRDARSYEIVKGSKEKIISQLSQEAKAIIIPEKIDKKALIDMSSSLIRFSNVIERNTKNIFYVSTMFSEQIIKIKDTLKTFDEIQNEILNCLNSDSLKLFEKIIEKESEIKSLLESDKKLTESQEEIKNTMQNAEKRKAEAEMELEKYKNSKEYEEYEKSLSLTNEIKSEIEKEEMKIRATFSPLTKSLRSLNRIEQNKQKRRLIENYLENPIETIIREGGLVEFKNVLSELGTSIRDGKIKVQSETYLKERIDEITNTDVLSMSVTRHEKLKAELNELMGKKFGVLKQIEDAEGRLRQDDKEKLERELSKVQEKIGKTQEEINEMKKQLEDLFLKAGYEVKIV